MTPLVLVLVPPVLTVWVVTVGNNRYVVFGRVMSAGRSIAHTFDSTFNWLSDFVA